LDRKSLGVSFLNVSTASAEFLASFPCVTLMGPLKARRNAEVQLKNIIQSPMMQSCFSSSEHFDNSGDTGKDICIAGS